MAEIARANGVGVILSSVPPAASFPWRPEVKPTPIITSLNAWLRSYAERENIHYIDYYTSLAGPSGELRSDLGNDGVHPNRKGYAVMRRLLEAKLSGIAR
jgi:lysophospholipase L1-like esterase